ncbi:MAG TPA: DNA-binding protein [Syntrophaceae bacterium]|nr:DNA-binding protein [Syntrophaceae bacterium]
MIGPKSSSRNSYKSSLVKGETKALTAKQLADILQMSEQVIYRLSRAGEIPCLKIGKKTIRFELDKVKEALMTKKATRKKDVEIPIREKINSFQYVTLDALRTGKAKLMPPKNLRLERFKIKVPRDMDITTLAYERDRY